MATTSKPLLPNIGVLGLVPDCWSLQWQPRHHVLTRLARYFHVVWVNPAHEWRSIVTRWKTSFTEPPHIPQLPGFRVYTPEFWLPQLYRPTWLANHAFHQRLRHARRLLTSEGCQKIVLYLWRPEFQRALMSIPFDLSCYHIDDEYFFIDVELPLNETEKRLITTVDQVFIHSLGLMEKKAAFNPHVAFVPNGVDYQAYAEPIKEPVDLTAIPKPRIGYTGFIKRQLDWPLLLNLTETHTDSSFVFVGPLSPHSDIIGVIQELSKRRNVYFLGAKSVQDLAAYPQHFDVCIMPYRANDYTKYIYPLKLHEYLASGRPTVGTKIRSLEEVADVVTLANTPDEWSAAIREALAPAANTADRRAARQRVAQQHDWQLLVQQIAQTMAQRLGPEFAEQLAASLKGRARPGLLGGGQHQFRVS